MNKVYFSYLFSAVPLGSIKELPAKSCAEIKASERTEVAEGKRWIYSDENAEQAMQASCHGIFFILISLGAGPIVYPPYLSPVSFFFTGFFG